MTKLSYAISAVLFVFLTSVLCFTTPVYSQTIYPTKTKAPTKVPDSCTGAVTCYTSVYSTSSCCCSCPNRGKMVYIRCVPLGGGESEKCSDPTCNTSSICGPTLAPTGIFIGCQYCPGTYSWTKVAQWDCGGSSCGCNERRTIAYYCNGTHCYDNCQADTSCTAECVVTPTPTNTPYYPPGDTTYYGILQAKVVTASASDLSCSTIAASTDYLSGTLVTFSPDIGEAKLVTDSILSWVNVETSGSTVYGISSTPPGQYELGNICVSTNGGTYTQASAGTLLASGTLDFVVAYLPQSGWVQAVGGNAYAASSIISSIPSTVSTYFALAGAMGDAGIVSYGSTYDFSLDYADFGETLVSAKKWLVQQVNTTTNYYEHFARQMDVPSNATVIETPTNLEKPTTCTTAPCVYYVDGDMTTSTTTPWAIESSEQTVVFVNGNVTINDTITVASGGFFAIIANGNITVDPTITTLHGIYIASNATGNAQFNSGAGLTQLVVTGSVIADNFSLQRDLGGALNPTTPGEVFTFDPQLLFTMPDTMKETPYVWQEVAP